MRTKNNPSAIQVFLLLGILVASGLKAEMKEYASSGDRSPSTKKIFYFSQQNNSHHRPASFLSSVRQEFGERGIQFTTSINRNDLNLDNLNQYDGSFFFVCHQNSKVIAFRGDFYGLELRFFNQLFYQLGLYYEFS